MSLEAKGLAGALDRAFAKTGKLLDPTGDPTTWWPGQAECTVLSWALGFELAFNHCGLGANEATYVWVCSSLGKLPSAKLAIAAEYDVRAPDTLYAGTEYARRGRRRMSASEYLVDFSIWRRDDHPGRDLLFTMESETYPSHGVGASASPEDGYSYDFYKLLLIPSPFRLFVCQVNDSQDPGENRRRKLLKSLSTLARYAADEKQAYLRSVDELAVVILPTAYGKKPETIAAVWRNGAFEEMLPNGARP